jgi:F-type H+-transporting ATPase subunit b
LKKKLTQDKNKMEKLINDFSVGLFFWQSLLFIALILLLKKFAWGPILNAVEEREEGIKEALELAEKAKEEMQALNADNERILAEARIERDILLKEAREMKDKIVSEAKDQANTEADKILLSAKEQINNEKLKAITELKNQVADMSIDIAEKILRSELSDVNKQKELVAQVLKSNELN